MTRQQLREHYAGLAMQALLNLDPAPHITPHHTASIAVKYADALLDAVQCPHENHYTLHGMKTCHDCKQMFELK